MKKIVTLIVLVLITLSCNDDTQVEDTNDFLISSKILEILQNPDFKNAIAKSSFSKKEQQKNSSNNSNGAFIVESVIGLVYIQFTNDGVFAFVGGDGSDRIKHLKNGSIQFSTKSKNPYCVLVNPITLDIIYGNICSNSPKGSLAAYARIKSVVVVNDIPDVGIIYDVNGESLINANKIAVTNEDAYYDEAANPKIVCLDNATEDRSIMLKRETDEAGNIIELEYSIN